MCYLRHKYTMKSTKYPLIFIIIIIIIIIIIVDG